MDWFHTWFSPIVILFAQIVLAGFTIVLAIATVKLHRSMERYVKATEELVQVTEQSTKATTEVAQSTKLYTEVSKKLLNAERLNLADKLFYNTRVHQWAGRYQEVYAEINNFADRVDRIYAKLTTEMLDDVENVFSHNDKD